MEEPNRFLEASVITNHQAVLIESIQSESEGQTIQAKIHSTSCNNKLTEQTDCHWQEDNSKNAMHTCTKNFNVENQVELTISHKEQPVHEHRLKGENICSESKKQDMAEGQSPSATKNPEEIMSESSIINTKITPNRTKSTVSSVEDTCTLLRTRPKRKVTLNRFVKHKPNADNCEVNKLFDNLTFNCVMCSKNFDELITLETHVRSHDEVVHFSIILKPAASLRKSNSSTKSLTKRTAMLKENTSATNKKSQKINKKCTTSKKLVTRKKLTKNEINVTNSHSHGELNSTDDQEKIVSKLSDVGKAVLTADEDEKDKKTDGENMGQQSDRKKQMTSRSYVLLKRKGRGRPSHALECPECKIIIASKLEMKRHYRTAHKRKECNTQTTCDICQLYCVSVKSLREHLTEEHDLNMSAHNKIYKCPFCDEYFDRKSPLLIHKREAHPGQTNYTCDDCGKKCQTPSELIVHRRSHTGEKPFQCEQCNVQFRFANSLKEHKRIHTGEQPFQCDVCGKKFARACNRRRHMISHTGKFTHRCEYCGKGFNDVGPLKIHIRMHTGERPFQCDMCEMRFVTKAQMQCHKAKHTQERSHLCQVCGAAFLYSVDLRRHTKIHTGIRNYKCNECNAAFFRLDHLKRHKRSHAANSKRLANNEWKPRSASKTKSADGTSKTETPVAAPDVAAANTVCSLPVVEACIACVICNAGFTSDDELQQHMMLHMKQSNMAYVIRDMVQGNNSGEVSSANAKSDHVANSTFYQQITSEDSGQICTMCNSIVVEPGGLKQHVETVHQQVLGIVQ